MQNSLLESSAAQKAYILKVGYAGYKNPQMILNFPQRDCLRTRKLSRLHCLQSYWRSSPLFMFSHCNKLSIKTLKHTIFSTKMPHWHQILVIFMIYALLSRNFAVRIYALFPQIFGNWKVESADFSLLECMSVTSVCAVLFRFLLWSSFWWWKPHI